MLHCCIMKLFILFSVLIFKVNCIDREVLDDNIVNHVGVLDLLDQYVLHVEKQEKSSMDLLDQYVIHVGETEKRKSENVKLSKLKDHKSKRVDKRDYDAKRWVRRKVLTVSEGISDSEITSDDSVWSHSVWLGSKEKIKLSWAITGEYLDRVNFQLEASTKGYIGIGFSPNGDIAGADFVVGWIGNDGTPHIIDCHVSVRKSAPQIDADQNYLLLAGYQNKTHTLIRFSRSLDTCDKDQDFKLGSDTTRVIWILQDQKPLWIDGELSNFVKHKKEYWGVQSIHLLSPRTSQISTYGDHVQYWDVNMNGVLVPDNMDTLYWCKIFKSPSLNEKHHIIGYEPILQGGHESLIHHILLYECVPPHNASGKFDRYATQHGAACYGNNMPADWEQCLTPVVAWAIGSTGDILPEHIGIPLSESHVSKYFMMEIHYDNPMLREAYDNSGLRIFHTRSLRQYDGAILVSGITVTPLHIVPPHQLEYKTAGYCSSLCTQKMFPQTGIKLVSVLLHSHLAGKKMKVRHIRDGKELPHIVEDSHYDFNYQQSRILQHEVEVLPGDEIITECTYQTPNRTEPTFGGYSTKQEMCLAFILYYPQTSLAACYSMTPVKYFFETFGIKQFYNIKMDTVERIFLKLGLSEDEQLMEEIRRLSHTTSTTIHPVFEHGDDVMNPELNQRAILALKKMKDFSIDSDDRGSGSLLNELVISDPPEFRNKSFVSHLFELPWEERLLTQRVEESLISGQHMVFCRKQNDELAIPAIVSMFPNFTKFQDINGNVSHCNEKLKTHSYVRSSARNTVVTIPPLHYVFVIVISYIMFVNSYDLLYNELNICLF